MKKFLRLLGAVVGVIVVLLVLTFFGLKAMWAGDSHGVAPESATGIRDVAVVETKSTMVVAAHPEASKAGYALLAAGGSALDAAVAVQAALTVVEPQSSGIGGGAFLLYWDASKQKLYAYDGRETAPAAATPSLFMAGPEETMDFVEAVVGGRSVGAPGVLAMLAKAHETHGKRPWSELFGPATKLAAEGFEISPRLYALLRRDPLFRAMPAARAHFYDEDGAAKAIGTRLTNPALAEVFGLVASDVRNFYEGPIAKDIVRTVHEAKRPPTWVAGVNALMLEMGSPSGSGVMASEPNEGLLTEADLKAYEPVVREPVCVPYAKYRVCGFPPPTSGGITTLQIIALMGRFDLKGFGPKSPQFVHLFAEASRAAFADRAKYIADPEFVEVPTETLLSKAYLDERAKLLEIDRRAPKLGPGKVEDFSARFVAAPSPERPCTSHFVVVDAEGDMVSMTTSVENVFGSRLMVRGFVLNNQLTDFSYSPVGSNGKMVANAVEAKKRPRSSMSPLMVFDETGAPVLAIGSPGGSRIIDYVARATLGVIEFGLSPQDAVELPHVINRGDATELENRGWKGGELEAAKKYLEQLGHEVHVVEENSGLHAIQRISDGWRSAADPRREGEAFGD